MCHVFNKHAVADFNILIFLLNGLRRDLNEIASPTRKWRRLTKMKSIIIMNASMCENFPPSSSSLLSLSGTHKNTEEPKGIGDTVWYELGR